MSGDCNSDANGWNYLCQLRRLLFLLKLRLNDQPERFQVAFSASIFLSKRGFQTELMA